LGIDERLKRLEDKASKRLIDLGFHKKRHFQISDEVGLLLDQFYERYIKPSLHCLQIKSYEPIIDSAIAITLEGFYPGDTSYLPKLQPEFRIKSLMKQFLAKKVIAR